MMTCATIATTRTYKDLTMNDNVWETRTRSIGEKSVLDQESRDTRLRGWSSPRPATLSWITIARVLYQVLDENKRPTGRFVVRDQYSDDEFEAVFCADAHVDHSDIVASFRMIGIGEYVLVARGKDKDSYNFILQAFTGFLAKGWNWLKLFQLGEGNDIKPGEIINVGPRGSRIIQDSTGVVHIAPGDIAAAALGTQTLKKNPIQEFVFDPIFGARLYAEKLEIITSAGAKFYGLRSNAHKTPGNPLTDPSRVTEMVNDVKSNPLSSFVETMEGNLSTSGIPGGGGTPLYQKNVNNKVMIRGWRSGKYEVIANPAGPPAEPLPAEVITANAEVATLKHVMDPLTQSHSIVGTNVNINGGTVAQNPSVSLNIESLITSINSKHPGTGTVNINVGNVTIQAAQITLQAGTSTIVVNPAGVVITAPTVTII